MYACTSCTIVSLSTTCVNFNTPPLTWIACNFDARLLSKTRKYRSTNKLRKHVCQLILVSNNSKRPSLVNCISTNPECRSDHRWPVYKHSLVVSALSVIARLWALKFSPSGRSVSVHKISRCILPLLCTLPLLCFLQLLS